MSVFQHYRDLILDILKEMEGEGALPAGLNAERVTVEPPRDPAHGDLSTNAAMVLAKPAGLKPRDLAQGIADRLAAREAIDPPEIAGPGFINWRLSPAYWQSQIGEVLRMREAYGASEKGADERVNVEYVSANPTGPMHVGHTRGAVFGDALAALLEKVGYEVCREYYINDAGAQVDVLARSAFLRYREALGEDIGSIPEGLYPGDYLKPVGTLLKAEYGEKLAGMAEAEWLPIVKNATIDAMMELIRGDLAALGITHEVFYSERTLHAEGAIDRALAGLEERGLIYEGVLEPPKGKTPEDWEPTPQTLFRSSDYGDDMDRALKKSDGSWTYFAADIAYHLDKFERGYRTMIDVWGADHAGYIKRVTAALAAATGGEAAFDVKVCQLVKLFRDGEPVRMSKRSGDFVTLREVVDEVGKDAVRFMMLMRRNDAPLDFDFAKVLEQSKDNPVFYVQYAHARISSVFRQAKEQEGFAGLDTGDNALAGADLSLLTDEAELELVKLMASYPRTVELAADAHEPHRIAFYLYDLASALHGLWNKGNDDPSLRFLRSDDPEVTLARLALIRAIAYVLRSGLGILGVEPAEEM